MKDLKKLASNLFLVKGANASAIVQFGGNGGVNDAGFSDPTKSAGGLRGSHVPWGEKDDALLEMHKICCENPTKWRLITTRRDFVVGKGLKVKDRTVENDSEVLKYVDDAETKEIENTLKRFRIQKLMSDAALQLEFSGRYFVRLTLGLDKLPAKIELIDVFQCRPRKLVAGETAISAYILNPNFGTKHYSRRNDIEIPAFDFENPTKYAVSLIDVREHLPGQFYNSFATWWGTKQWTINANKIAKFHTSGLDNGYNIKYHISFPDDYFDKEGLEGEDEVASFQEEIIREIGDALSGVDSVNKMIFTFHKSDVNGREMSGVRITPLDNKMSDTGYAEIFKIAMMAAAQAHGLLPVQAGIDTGGKLGGSGKELEVAANYTQSFLTNTSRLLLLEIFEVLKSLYGWSEKKVAVFENIKIYNYDVTPAGSNTNPVTQIKSNGTN